MMEMEKNNPQVERTPQGRIINDAINLSYHSKETVSKMLLVPPSQERLKIPRSCGDTKNRFLKSAQRNRQANFPHQNTFQPLRKSDVDITLTGTSPSCNGNLRSFSHTRNQSVDRESTRLRNKEALHRSSILSHQTEAKQKPFGISYEWDAISLLLPWTIAVLSGHLHATQAALLM